MIENFFDYFINDLNIFDIIFSIIMVYCIFQCFLKGFSLSFISFMKWILSLVITIILVPKIQPWVSEYVESEFINNIGLGAFIFILSLFCTIVVGKSLSRAVTWTGMGSIDKSFGLIFGIFKGYIICVCIFSLLNWFYPYKKWQIKTEETYSFKTIYVGSEFLIKELPNSKDHYEEWEKLIEKI